MTSSVLSALCSRSGCSSWRSRWSSLVGLDRRKHRLRVAGERRDEVPGLQAVIAGDRLVDGGGGHFMPPVVGTPPARLTAAVSARPTESAKQLASATPEESW